MSLNTTSGYFRSENMKCLLSRRSPRATRSRLTGNSSSSTTSSFTAAASAAFFFAAAALCFNGAACCSTPATKPVLVPDARVLKKFTTSTVSRVSLNKRFLSTVNPTFVAAATMKSLISLAILANNGLGIFLASDDMMPPNSARNSSA